MQDTKEYYLHHILISVTLNRHTEELVLGYVINLVLYSWGNLLFSMVSRPFHIPTMRTHIFQFLQFLNILTSICWFLSMQLKKLVLYMHVHATLHACSSTRTVIWVSSFFHCGIWLLNWDCQACIANLVTCWALFLPDPVVPFFPFHCPS